MIAIDAYEDACRTVRHWQNGGVTLAMIAVELGCRRPTWQAVIDRIVFDLLLDADGRQLPLPFTLVA